MKTFIGDIVGRSCIINGKTYKGSNIQIIDGTVIVDGQEVECGKIINIEITGDVGQVTTAAGDVSITGTVKEVETTSGDIRIRGDVSGNVKSVSGDVVCEGAIHGSVKTVSGDIR